MINYLNWTIKRKQIKEIPLHHYIYHDVEETFYNLINLIFLYFSNKEGPGDVNVLQVHE